MHYHDNIELLYFIDGNGIVGNEKNSISSHGSSKAPNTKAFYICIWIQVIEKLNFIYLFGERFLTTISPVSSQNVKPKLGF